MRRLPAHFFSPAPSPASRPFFQTGAAAGRILLIFLPNSFLKTGVHLFHKSLLSSEHLHIPRVSSARELLVRTSPSFARACPHSPLSCAVLSRLFPVCFCPPPVLSPPDPEDSADQIVLPPRHPRMAWTSVAGYSDRNSYLTSFPYIAKPQFTLLSAAAFCSFYHYPFL